MKTTYNIDQIVAVSFSEQKISTFWSYCPEQKKKTWFGLGKIKTLPEEWYEVGEWHGKTREQMQNLEEYKLIGNDVYRKSKVVIAFSNGEMQKFFFDTDKEAEASYTSIRNLITNKREL